MILIGDSLIDYEQICKISSIDEIKNTKPNSTLLFNYNSEILKYCSINDLSQAVIITNIKEAIYANAFDVKYIICEKDLAIKAQKIAESYMFDSKILAIIESNDELEYIAINEIDGVIFKKII